jgi:hypothetical protein
MRVCVYVCVCYIWSTVPDDIAGYGYAPTTHRLHLVVAALKDNPLSQKLPCSPHKASLAGGSSCGEAEKRGNFLGGDTNFPL